MKTVVIGYNFNCKKNIELNNFLKKHFEGNDRVTIINSVKMPVPFIQYYQDGNLVKIDQIITKELAYSNIIFWLSEGVSMNTKMDAEKEEILKVSEWYRISDKKIKCLIVNWNRVGLLEKIAKWCADHGLEVIIVDNASTYEPLLEWYKTCPYTVERMDKNYGHKVVWEQGVVDKYIPKDERYIVTDSDLDLSNLPDDWLLMLHYGLDKYHFATKCGFYLKNDDLPINKYTTKIKQLCYISPGLKLSNYYGRICMDTTFSLYNKNCRHYTIYNTIAVYPPEYQIKHIPWYYNNFESLPDDEKYYLACRDNVNPNTFIKDIYGLLTEKN